MIDPWQAMDNRWQAMVNRWRSDVVLGSRPAVVDGGSW